MLRMTMFRLLWVAAFCLFGIGRTGLALPFQEHAADCSTSSEPIWICYGDHATCSFDTTVDTDVFLFPGSVGDHVRLTVKALTGGLDLRAEIHAPSGLLIDTPTCDSGCCGACGFSHDIPALSESGIYLVLVQEWGSDQSGSYTIDLQRIPALTQVPDIDYNESIVVTMDHHGDHDLMTFEGVVGSNILISVSANTGGLDPRMELYEPYGSLYDSEQCDSGCCGACSFSLPLTLPRTGTYTLVFSEWGLDQTGSYSVNLQCLSPGLCPDPLPSDPVGTNYCISNPNSSGSNATISASGSQIILENVLFLRAIDVPIGEPGIFFMSQNQTQNPVPLPAPSSGLLCVGSPTIRLPVVYTCNGNLMEFRPDLSSLPLFPGQTWNFQGWFRDGSTSNTTDGLSITFQ